MPLPCKGNVSHACQGQIPLKYKMYCGVFGGLGRSKGLSLREKRNRDIYVIHATVCDVSHYWWGSVDV